MKKYMVLALIVGAIVFNACSSSPRTPLPTPNVQIGDVWLNASEINRSDFSAPIYMTLTNTGGTAVGQLIGAQTQVVTSNNVVASTQLRNGDALVPTIDIPINGKVQFSPTGYHIQVTSLPPSLKAGDTFPLTLAFSGGDNRIVTVGVRP